VPHVSVDEALNLALLDLEEIEREPGAGSWRKPLVASDAVRVVLLRVVPGEEPHPPHRHPHSDEVLVVMSGVGAFSIGEDPEVLAGPSSILYVARGVRHRIRVPGPAALVWLSIVAPNQDAADEAVEAVGGRA
jgi:mannose-6-phosphate isomerase-like protein (cupin superfamily)